MPILMPVCDRPYYLKRVLDGLTRVDGINETLLVVSQDCDQAAITSLLVSISSSIRVLILPHTPPYFSLPRYVDTNEYATSANVKFLLEFAFEYMLADGAILLESDLIPSVDFYRYHQWTYQHLLKGNNSTVLSIHSFNIDSTSSSDPYSLFSRGFDSWGWSTARTRWNWLKSQWTKYNSWDSIVSRRAKQDKWKCLIPKLSRTRMIGLKGINVNVKLESEKKKFEEVIGMMFRLPPTSTDLIRLWIYCITGVATVVLLMIMVCYYAFRQECSDRAERRRAKELHYTQIQELQRQVDSFPDLVHRPASDILMKLGIGEHQPRPVGI
ncbi:unnamed protein product [Adineta ricciae]|uniref:Alpha-1,3-mannosyl-glycoprotein 2-beta-N-acetylglucosaminyltransferase n=1 Tax=Adineta ricciae TaxID=249248 RepID=A0A814Y937_ADIRI|nr:unnamed protein product [Adineta ricciae]